MDDIDLTGLRTKAVQSGTELANLTGSAPNLLNEFKSSLTNVFAKDNPLIQERDKALSTFLSTPANTRAELLQPVSTEFGMVRPNLSPTQQNAIVTSRYNAALAPLLGLNQAVTAGYGGIGDVVSGAGTSLQALIQAEQLRNQQAQQEFSNALAQQQERRLQASANAGTGLDLASILALIQGSQPQQSTSTPGSTFKPDETSVPTTRTVNIPGQTGTIQLSNNPPGIIQNPQIPPLIPARWNPFAQLGALPELIFGRNPIPAQPTTSFSQLSQQNYGPFTQ